MDADAEPQILIVGGGPAGSAAAMALARAGHRVAVVLPGTPKSHRAPPGEALIAAARTILGELGVLSVFEADGHRPCFGNASSWGSDELLFSDSIFDPHGHGWHLDRGRFDSLLREHAARSGVELWPGTSLSAIARDASGKWCVTLRRPGEQGGERTIHCDWIVDASGRRRVVAEKIAGAAIRYDTLVALHAVFEPAGAVDQDSHTLVESVPGGWWYTVLLPSGDRVVTFLTDVDGSDPARLNTGPAFVGQLLATKHVAAATIGRGYRLRGRPRGTDCSTRRLRSVVGHGWIAVGDAAMSVDPLSSVGTFNALYTGLRAGMAVDEAIVRGGCERLNQYQGEVNAIFASYWRHLAAVYAGETRWPDRPFWHRRHAAGEGGTFLPSGDKIRTTVDRK